MIWTKIINICKMWQHSKVWEPSNTTQARLFWERVKYVITFVLLLLNYIKLVVNGAYLPTKLTVNCPTSTAVTNYMQITVTSRVDRTELYSCTVQNNSQQLHIRVPVGDIPYVTWPRSHACHAHYSHTGCSSFILSSRTANKWGLPHATFVYPSYL